MGELHHLLRPGEVPQPVAAEVGQPGTLRQAVDDEVVRGPGHHRLAAVGEIAQAGRPVHGRAHVVALVAQLRLAGVEADTEPDGGQRGPLQIEGAGHGFGGAGEGDHEAVALALLHGAHPSMAGDRFTEDAIEARHGLGHGLRLGFPQPGRAFDVGQQKRDRAGR